MTKENILHSNILGEGQPFIILHGFLGMGDNWKTHGKNLSEHGFEVHLVDQRNHGRSFWSNTFNYEILVQDLKQYCDAHELKNIVLLAIRWVGKRQCYLLLNFQNWCLNYWLPISHRDSTLCTTIKF